MRKVQVVRVPIDIEQLKHCRVCGSGSLRLWRKACRDTSSTVGIRFSYVRCADCRAAQLGAGPTAGSAGAFYPDNYAPYNRPSPAVMAMFEDSPEVSDPLRRAVRSTYALPRHRARLLDFGCGSPATLDAARTAGWSGTGVDFSPLVVRAVRAAGHDGLLVDELPVAEAEPYDVVRGNHVIEHVYDPRDVLEKLISVLRPGGVLHLATPNPDGVGSMLFRRSWFSLDAPRHVVLFPPHLLTRLLVEAGADRVTVLHEVVTKDLVRSATYLRQELTGATGDATAGDGSRLLNLAVRPLAALAARWGRADRYHVFAHKRA
jgi:2-polyprenyl-3-methyl-5-hydroxy-6-metoxy-1,4-benzoquinol methylase